MGILLLKHVNGSLSQSFIVRHLNLLRTSYSENALQYLHMCNGKFAQIITEHYKPLLNFII